jgi:GT2 family glycosyltransferase
VGRASVPPLDANLLLEPVSRRPLRLAEETMRTLITRGLPQSAPERGPLQTLLDATTDGPSASVIVVTWENLALTRLCLESLLAHTHDVPFELIIVDNGSTDGTAAYLQALAAAEPRVGLILNEHNDGFARACNQGARAAVGDILVFLNNDTVLSPGWLRGLVAHLRRSNIGAVNAVTNRIGTEAEVSERARTFGEFIERAARRRVVHAGESRTVEMLASFCLALRSGVWRQVGPLDETFGCGLFADADYSERLRAAGYRLICAEDVLVHHLGEASFGRLVVDGTYGALFDANRRRFESKWEREWRLPSRSADDSYCLLIERIRMTVSECVSAEATIAVVSRGDDLLLDLGGATAWHFPVASDGWAGHCPATTAAVVAQVEAVRLAGADHLLLPEPAFWWLDHYPGFGNYLERHGEEVARTPDLRLYHLVGSPDSDGDPAHIETSMERVT